MPFFNQREILRSHGSRSEKIDLCTFCRPRKDGRSSVRSCKNTSVPGERGCYGKLSKPPKVKSRKIPTTRRLQKQHTKSSIQLPVSFSSTVYILQFEAYPYNTMPAVILGIFSTIDTVTAGAISHGAYAFSREGLHDGSEYLSPTGRIRIFTEQVQGYSPKPAPRPETYIPHPDPRIEAKREAERRTLYIAIRQAPSKGSCIGLFSEKIKAWTACVKDQTMTVSSHSLSEEIRWSDENGMPHIRGKIKGSGSHLWFVNAFELDKVIR